VKAEGSRFVGSCRNDPSPVRLATDYNRFTLEFGIKYLFHRNEERVEVDMDDVSACHMVTPYRSRLALF
jgi:hypothetical protein